MRKCNLILLLLFFSLFVHAENNPQSDGDSIKPASFLEKYERPKSSKVQVNGYYRFYIYHRFFDEAYENVLLTTGNRFISVFDGYFDPNLRLDVTINPSSKTSISTDIFLFTPYTGRTEENLLTNFLMLNLSGNIRTDVGRFGVKAGGIYWFDLSPFTMGSPDIPRYSTFTRSPYDAAGQSAERYSDYYKAGETGEDERFTFQAFKGLAIDGIGVPGDISFKLLYGKNNANINPLFLPAEVPNFMAGGRLQKDIKGKNQIAFNTMNSFVFTDTANSPKQGFNMLTLSHRFFLKDVLFEGEFGFGRFRSDSYQEGWGHGWNLKVITPKSLTFIPLTLQLYHIDKNFVNNVSAFANTSVPEINFIDGPGGDQAFVNQPFASPINAIGQLANNRFGLNFNAEVEVENFILNVGYGIASEKERLSDDLSFVHRINGLTISRIFPFQGNVGPYDRLSTYYGGTFEVIQIQFDTAGQNKKFNNLEFQAKYKFDIGERNIYFFYNGSINSVQGEAHPFPLTNNQAWLRAYYHEVEAYFQVFPKTFFSVYLGLQKIKTNADTNLDSETIMPSEQVDKALGLGLDIDITKNTGLYLRHKWFKHEDINFGQDLLRGKETTVELKTFF